MKLKKFNKRGFSLVELLATILVVSIVLGMGVTYVTKTINNSKEKSQILALNNIKKTANTYIEEYSNDIAWINDNNKETSFSCVSINSLINKGYISNKDITNDIKDSGITPEKYIIVTRDQNKNIISQEFDNNNNTNEGKCNSNIQKVKIPTSKEYCNNLYYNGKIQKLVSTSNLGFSINQTEIEKKEAGDYKITAKLNTTDQINNKRYVWSDDTTSDKTFTCKIKKKKPTFNIITPEQGESGENLSDTEIALTSDVPGTIEIKSSNKAIATANFNSNTNEINENIEKKATIKKYATKSSVTYITFILTPSDSKNYDQATTVYTIGKINIKKVAKPKCKNNLYYNFEYQELVKPSSEYTLINNIQKENGKYNVIAKLKYGYKWEKSENTTDYKMECEIQKSKFILSYDDNGGTGCSNQKKDIYYNLKYGTLSTLCIPKRTGYTFNGWNTKNNGTGKKIEDNTVVTYKNDHTIYAQWKNNIYTVKYNGNKNTGGNTTESQHKYDVPKNLTTNGFTKKGYTFSNWNTKADNSGTPYKNNQSVKNLTSINGDKFNLYAHWKANTYIVKYNGNGSTSGSTKESQHTYDVAKDLTPNGFSKTGYTFSSWNTEANNSGTPYKNNQSVKNLTSTNKGTFNLYAHWKANTYTVKYNGNKNTGGATNSSTHTYNIAKDLTTNGFKRKGYMFNGWNTKENGSGTPYKNKQSVKNLTSINEAIFNIYAQWTAKTYTIKYNGNGNTKGSTKESQHVYDQVKNLTANGFIKNNYIFNGWNTKADGTGTRYKNKQAVVNLTSTNKDTINLYAQWILNRYTLTYDSNGGTSCSSKVLNYNDNFDLSCSPTKTGYTFNGWYTDKTNGTKITTANRIQQNTTIYAHWTLNTYTLTYDSNGGTSCSSKVLNYNDNFDLSCSPTKNGYTFNGWYTDKTNGTKVTTSNRIQQNTTIYAHWTPNKKTITVTFNKNDGSGTTAVQTFTQGESGNRFGYNNDGSEKWRQTGQFGEWNRDGYTLLGWASTSNATSKNWDTYSGVSDNWIAGYAPKINLYAVWTENVCTITFSPNGGTFNKHSNDLTKKLLYSAEAWPIRNVNGGYYNATRAGYHTVDGKDWISSDNRTFNEDNKYTAKQLCPNLAKGNQSVTLKVNWNNKWYLCREGDTCLNAIADWKDCSYKASKITSNNNIRGLSITGETGNYFMTTKKIKGKNKTVYIWKGCLRKSAAAAKTDCPSTCVG